MNDYIEREEAEKIFVEYNCVKYHVTEMGDTNEANSIILMFRENAKKLFSIAHSADVAPVRHGHWILVTDVHDLSGRYKGEVWECSECGYSFERLMGCGISMRMCHDCGARMDKEEEA